VSFKAKKGFSVRTADWSADSEAIRSVRRVVFIEEQHVYPREEWDGLDPLCDQFLAEDDRGNAIGTARLSAGGKLGRMAVVKQWRGRGVGAALIKVVVELARGKGIARLEADAQVRALDFYARQGFSVYGPEFLDARIVHRKVCMDIPNN